MTVTIARTLDCKGLSCPMPIVKTAQAIRTMTAGDLIEVLATDPGSVKDFAAWSKATGNELVETGQTAGVFSFVLMKKR
jgi:tRNA 2-thiouridine synthesizing protein A